MTAAALRSYEAAGAILRKVRGEAGSRARAGVRYLDLAVFVEGEISRLGGRPAFPCNVSVNEVASHYTPSADDAGELKPGDLVKIDLGVVLDGYIADSAISIGVATTAHQELIDAAGRVLTDAIGAIRPGALTGEIGGVIESSARAYGFSVLKDLYGHALDKECLHGGLTIPSYDDGSRQKIREGDVLAIEPFLTEGNGEIARLPGGNIFQLARRNYAFVGMREKKLLMEIENKYNGFPFARRWLEDREALEALARQAIVAEYPVLVEKDGMPVAQAEHTVIVGGEGCKIIT
jgi:methionyl aminopeptidase